MPTKTLHESETSLVWFRADLRLTDNPALSEAIAYGNPVIPVFIGPPEDHGAWPPGGARRWWLHHSLHALDSQLQRVSSRLIILQGTPENVLPKLCAQCNATAVFWNRCYEPAVFQRDESLIGILQSAGYACRLYNSALLVEPWEIASKAGTPYRVFTPFWKACQRKAPPAEPLACPTVLHTPPNAVTSLPLEALNLLETVQSNHDYASHWTPGESGAMQQLAQFIEIAVPHYAEDRDRPDKLGTSRLSPHLCFGEIGPRQIWHALHQATLHETQPGFITGSEAFLRQLYWREFAYHLLFHAPHTPRQPLREHFNTFPWASDEKGLQAWQEGRTGYPYIDAGMRQLLQSGWMHNRVRMAVASFLVKDLLLPWQEGAAWFWEHLVDADLANNTLGWQWVAGCGADAAPYFRIFNPVSQGERFDPQGSYIRRWLPELAALPDRYLHRPWEAPAAILREANVDLGSSYPHPILNHSEARERALLAYETIRK